MKTMALRHTVVQTIQQVFDQVVAAVKAHNLFWKKNHFKKSSFIIECRGCIYTAKPKFKRDEQKIKRMKKRNE